MLAIALYDVVLTIHIIAGAVLTPADKRLVEISERDQRAGAGPSADYAAEARRADIFGSLALLLVVVAIFLMVAKPGA